MDLLAHYQMLARYNRIANERLYRSCRGLTEEEFQAPRRGSLGSIRGLLNHILLGDRVWMALFEGIAREAPARDTLLFEAFPDLQTARVREDEKIETFFGSLAPVFLARSFAYVNHQGRNYVEAAPVALAHFFNHQTHHRGQVHVMLSQTGAMVPSLDLHRILNP